MNSKLASTFVFAALAHGALPFAAGSARAQVPEGWTAGADVTIDTTVVLDAATPELNSVTVADGGTLVFTNWSTRLLAKTVTIKSGGTVTCAGPFWTGQITRSDSVVLDEVPSNRVWIAATEALTVEAGGKIDVDGKGYGTDFNVFRGTPGFGPGATSAQNFIPAYGGRSSGPEPYGDPVWPFDPGSSGGARSDGSAGVSPRQAGGGAVFLDCPQAVVTVNGSVTAVGMSATSLASAGTGGAILIDAKRLVSSTGALSVKGGAGIKSTSYGNRSDATGGRIAIHYDTAVETADDLGADFTIDAGPGNFFKYSDNAETDTGYSNANFNWTAPGSVWFSDTLYFEKERPTFSGEPQFAAGDGAATLRVFKLTSGFVVFGNALTNVTVTGDFSLDGDNSFVRFGANTIYATSGYYTFVGGTIPRTLAVGGDMTIARGARMDVFAVATNGVDACGAVISVAGDFAMSGQEPDAGLQKPELFSKLKLSCCPDNGGAPVIRANNVSVDSRSKIDADNRGFAHLSASGSAGLGPGRGHGDDQKSDQSPVGAGHGGCGGYGAATPSGWRETYGRVYDDPLRPTMAGSSASLGYNSMGTFGGGVIHLIADRKMTISGELTADSSAANRGAAGSGGSILLEAKSFWASATASLTANGGSHASQGTKAGTGNAAGGGGRIAVWIGAPGCGYDEVQTYTEIGRDALFDSAATVAAAAGAVGAYAAPEQAPGDGTIHYLRAARKSGLILLFR